MLGILLAMLGTIAACGSTVSDNQTTAAMQADGRTEKQELKMRIGDTPAAVAWEDNESVAALTELVSETPITIQMSMYGGFEQVGSLGSSLPRNDVQS